jgi:hypothetical protein
MGLETGSTISSFITSNPTSSDPVNQGDDHLRLIKSVLKAQFPGSAGSGFAIPITATEAEINALHGFTNIGFAAGTRMPFAQAAAPTGWTQDVTDNANNRMLRVVNTAGNGVGGSADPTLNNTVPYHTHGFSTGGQSANHVHYDSGHTHSFVWKSNTGGTTAGGDPNSVGNVTVSTGTGYASLGGISADHYHTGSTDGNSNLANWSPRYINMIICSKN